MTAAPGVQALPGCCPISPVPARNVAGIGRVCLNVIMNEECEHRRYAVRDLTVLETDLDDPPAHHDTAG